MPITRPKPEQEWSLEILEAARSMFNGTIRIYKPGLPSEPYDARDDSGGESGASPLLILGPRPARAQHVRLPVEANDGLGWSARRRFRFQCEILDGDFPITKGLVVRFEGGNDPVLEEIAFQVVSAVNSSHAALRTIECVTEAGPE